MSDHRRTLNLPAPGRYAETVAAIAEGRERARRTAPPAPDWEHFRDCIGDIADSYVPDPVARAEMIEDIMVTARDALRDAVRGTGEGR